jgi:hypothetical protein
MMTNKPLFLTTILSSVVFLLITTTLAIAQAGAPADVSAQAAEESIQSTGVASAWVTPLEIDFGPVGVGFTSLPQTVTITNTGTNTLTNFAGGMPPIRSSPSHKTAPGASRRGRAASTRSGSAPRRQAFFQRPPILPPMRATL